MTAHIIVHRYLNQNGSEMTIGGVQTYIANLCTILNEIGFNVIIYQYSLCSFEKKINDKVVVKGYISKKKNVFRDKKTSLKDAKKNFQSNDILIFALDNYITKDFPTRSLAIQHGIGWDLQYEKEIGKVRTLIEYFLKVKSYWNIIRRIKKIGRIVCVDYNFPNWFRTLCPYTSTQLNVICNFTQIPQYDRNKYTKNGNKVKIIFARRFQHFRGTRSLIKAMIPILDKYHNVELIIAGDGPDEQLLKDAFDRFDNVQFITYMSNDSLLIHKDVDIAIIPTLGSEGTSLSLLEAMASQCAVVSTGVGGISNVLIDNFNGLVVNPKDDSCQKAIELLINDSALRRRLADRAYQTVSEGFSYDIWKKKWSQVLIDYIQ